MLSLGGFGERRQGSVDSLDLELRITCSISGKVLTTTGMVLLFFGKVGSHRIMLRYCHTQTAGVGLIKRQQALSNVHNFLNMLTIDLVYKL